jgi:hypothetical protein
LAAAAEEFEWYCAKFIRKNPWFQGIELPILRNALAAAQGGEDVTEAARIFGDKITKTSQLMEYKKRIAGESFGGRVRAFLTGLYPAVKLSLDLTGAIADVSSGLCLI